MTESASAKKLKKLIKLNLGSESIEEACTVARASVSAAEAPAAKLIDALPGLCASMKDMLERAEDKIGLANRSLEISSRELTERNLALYSITQEMEAILKSLSQAVFMFDRSGVCLPFASASCAALLGSNPPGKKFTEVLGVHFDSAGQLDDWLELSFGERILFDDLVALLPLQERFGPKCDLEIEFKPVRNHEEKIDSVLVVVTDRKKERDARTDANRSLVFAQKIVKLVKDRSSYLSYRLQLHEALDSVCHLKVGTPMEEITKAKRLLHNVKGASSGFGAELIRAKIHNIERLMLLDFPAFVKDSESLVEEVRMALLAFESEAEDALGKKFFRSEDFRTLPSTVVEQFYSELQRSGADAWLVAKFKANFLAKPLKQYFLAMNDHVQRVAASLGKKVSLLNLELPSGLCVSEERAASLMASIVHVLINAVDHGIEHGAARISLGKPEAGLISVWGEVRASAEGDFLFLRVSDDGCGLAQAALRKRLIEAGMPSDEAMALPDEAVAMKIFSEGFSTKREATEFSGRGIGLSTVYEEVRKLGGKVSIFSKPGQGTALLFEIPMLALR
jgi:hypothetical protein